MPASATCRRTARSFPTLTVRQNLELGLKRAGKFGRWKFDDVFQLFPNLGERQDNPAGVLSGGEQQMLTMCRTLMGDPDLIMIDEPTEGLAPKLVEQVGQLLDEIARRGVAILLVEQKLDHRAEDLAAGSTSWATAASCSRARRPISPPMPPCARSGWKSDLAGAAAAICLRRRARGGTFACGAKHRQRET